MNEANEAAVGLFLRDQISYTDIATVVSTTVHSFSHFTPTALDQIVDLDTQIKHHIETQYPR